MSLPLRPMAVAGLPLDCGDSFVLDPLSIVTGFHIADRSRPKKHEGVGIFLILAGDVHWTHATHGLLVF